MTCRVGRAVRNKVVDNCIGRILVFRGLLLADDELQTVEHIFQIRHFVDAALRTDAHIALAVRVQIHEERVALCCVVRNGDRERVDHRVVLRLLVVAFRAGPDQCAVVRIPLKRRFVRVARCCSLGEIQLAVHAEVQLCACGARIVLDGQVDLDLLSGFDLVDIRIAGGVRCTVRYKVVDDCIGRIASAAAAVCYIELQVIELKRNVADFIDAALRPDAHIALAVFVQSDRIAAALCRVFRNRHREGVDH